MSSDTALLVIDVQEGFITSNPPIYQAEEMLERIGDLIKRAHAAQVPVIYVRHDEEPTIDGPIHPAIAPTGDEPVVSKMTPDSFYQTDLQDHLANLGVKNLVLCGFQTEYCIDTTTRRAFSMGYHFTLVENAHSTFGSLIIDAQTMIAHHTRVLSGFAKVAPAAKITF
jgi:nicotinamidase-related amidase